MEITFPMGTITPEFCAAIEAFYGDVFGFTFRSEKMFGQQSLTMQAGGSDFILLIEGDQAMSAPGFDHLGIELASRAEVDETLARVKRRLPDDRIELKEYDDGVMHDRLYHAYYVRYLLPIWFDVQFSEVVAAR
jgi:hypothetical protein